MAVANVSTIGGYLVTTYNREKFAMFERIMAPHFDSMMELESGGAPVGSSRQFGIKAKHSMAGAGVPDGGAFPDYTVPTWLKGTITPVTVAGDFQITEQAIRSGMADGTITAGEVISELVKDVRDSALHALNRLSIDHTTARMAVVETTTDTATTFTCRLPEGDWQIHPNDLIAFYDTDTSGSIQGAVETVSDANWQTRVVTIGNPRTLTAGWGVYRASVASSPVTEYGLGFNGMRAVIDNGTLDASIFGLTRSSNPNVLNATVRTAGSSDVLQSYSEKLVRALCEDIWFKTGNEPEEIWSNIGMVQEHYNFMTGNRIFNAGNGATPPSYAGGNTGELPVFYWRGKKIPFKVDGDIPARELYVTTRSLWRKYVVSPLGWVGDETGPDGRPSPILMQLPATSTYSLAKIAGLMFYGNAGHKLPAANSKGSAIADEYFGD